ncbi:MULTISPECIES: fimbria/pilus periplasmic chaperone [Enterobacterales]|uniref:fimbria/pilus periplasmic chaperone n=1 Tax=Enterobacterales TaxID=91347 RepID=UPI002EDA064B
MELKLSVLALCGFFLSLSVEASVVVGGTRVVFDGNKKETSISVENKDSSANLVQTWVSAVETGSPDKKALIITPPLFRLNPGERNVLRIVRSGSALPENKESMYWLNVKGITAVEKGSVPTHSLQLAINSRVKLIYRPAALKSKPEDFAGKLRWRVENHQLKVTNSSPHFMNFFEIKVAGKMLPAFTYVPPMSSASFSLAGKNPASGSKIEWSVINDFGTQGAVHRSVL